MTLKEVRDKIDAIITEHPTWADVHRIGIVDYEEPDTGWKEMTYLTDIEDICCDGQGMVAFELKFDD